MSLPSDTTQPTATAQKPSPFLENIIRFLMPYFLPVTQSPAEARADILETIASYGALTRSAMLSAAQAIAFGFATLETLQEAKDPDLSPSLRLRYRSCANTLTRSAEKAEHALVFKHFTEAPGAKPPPAKPAPAPQAAPAAPPSDISDPDAEAALAFARERIAEHRRKTENASPQPARRASILPARPGLTPEEQAENDLMWGQGMMRVLADMGMPVQRVTQSDQPSPAP